MQFSKGGGGDFTVLPKGNYVMRLLDVREGNSFQNREDPTKTDYTIRIVAQVEDDDDEYDGEEIHFFTPARFTAKNKTGALWAALLGLDDPKNLPDEIDSEQLIGRKFVARMKPTESGYNGYETADPFRPKRGKKTVAAASNGTSDETVAQPNF